MKASPMSLLETSNLILYSLVYVEYNDVTFYIQAIRQRAKKQRIAKKTSAAISSAVSSGTAAVVIENVAQTQRLDGSMNDERPTNTASGSNDEDDVEE